MSSPHDYLRSNGLSVIPVVLERCTVLNMITIGRISATLVSSFPVKGGLPHFAAQDISFE
jgi:hypothetical protein